MLDPLCTFSSWGCTKAPRLKSGAGSALLITAIFLKELDSCKVLRPISLKLSRFNTFCWSSGSSIRCAGVQIVSVALF